MAEVKQIRTETDLNAVINGAGSVLVLKHSTTCPISAEAYRQFAAFSAAAPAGVEFALVRVIEERPLSLALAERTGVKHESPQALLLKGGKVLWHASHWNVTTKALQEAASEANP